ncbi:hypothetical protein FA15DRAFT_700985 [Coprinopsis marcescibilis]|uniref:Transcription factor TFIIIC triple barrel domain-containing protein n=1 Tax=Coprinopsis marcescibilis TaxID=230819 RepID=A0A5C3L717_COPMA|nr:hypothetical protein FA15DRAFT_700985 [Coprinopsis marcescibilis]
MSFNHPSSLVPGFKQVESFGPDEEYEDEEEVTYVTLDLGNVEPTLVPSASSYYLIGLDTPTPFLQLQGTVLKGRHNNLLGTELIFSENKELHKRSMTHLANTEQRILFKEVTLEPKPPGSSLPTMSTSAPAPPATPQTKDATSEQTNTNQQIDRMTGKTAPPTRAPRGKGKKKQQQTAMESAVEESASIPSRQASKQPETDAQDPQPAPPEATEGMDLD